MSADGSDGLIGGSDRRKFRRQPVIDRGEHRRISNGMNAELPTTIMSFFGNGVKCLAGDADESREIRSVGIGLRGPKSLPTESTVDTHLYGTQLETVVAKACTNG